MNKDLYALGLSVLLLTTLQLNAQFNEPVTRYMEGVSNAITSDVNNDGYTEVIVGTRKGAFLLKNHFGDIHADQPTQLNYNDEVVLAFDVDGDGYQDILTASSVRKGVRWMHNQGDGTFSGEKELLDEGLIKHMISDDMDDDGDLDLLINTNDQGIVMYRNNGPGEFGEARIMNRSTATSIPMALDLDADGDHDLFWNEGTEAYWAENIDGRGIMGYSAPLFTNGRSIAADVDGDGRNDIVTLDLKENKVVWRKNLGAMGTFAEKQIITGGVRADGTLQAVDMENDGDLDLIFSSDVYDEVLWIENGNGKADFKEPVSMATDVIDPRFISLADIDGDGDRDLLTGSDESRSFITVASDLQFEEMVMGRLYHDRDKNGEFNAGDHGLVNRPVGLSDGRTAYTDNNGFYMFPATGGAYTISVQDQDDWVLTTGAHSQNVVIIAQERSSLGNDFGFAAKDATVSVKASLANGSTRSGMVSPYRVTVTNTGNTQGEVTAHLKADKNNKFVWSSLNAAVDENDVRWELGPLQPFETRSFDLVMNSDVDPGKELSDVLNVTITGSNGKTANAVDSLIHVSSNGNEDNLMKASPKGYGVEQAVSWNDELTFTASFTNTSGDVVPHVLVENPIHEWLDISTLEIVNSSHDHRIYIQPNGTVQFYFENIDLLDVNKDPMNSQVFVSFRIKPLTWVPHNTVIENQAVAFFGPEEQYETNYVTRVVGESITLGAQNWTSLRETNIVYPNPTNGPTTFDLTNYKYDRVEIHLIDQTGRVIFKREMRGGSRHEFQLASLGKGNYLVRALPLETGEAELLTKLVIQ